MLNLSEKKKKSGNGSTDYYKQVKLIILTVEVKI